MNTSLGKILTTILIVLTVTGCGLQSEAENNADPVATSVAETLEALGLGEESPAQSGPLPMAAYADGGELWISDRNGEQRLIHTSEDDMVKDLLFSPDGNRLVFTSRNQNWGLQALWEINADGTNLRSLIDQTELLPLHDEPNATGVQISYLDFIPGKKALTFSTWPFIPATDFHPIGDLQNLDLDSSALNTIIAPTGADIQYRYSPDGSKIAFFDSVSFGLMDPNGGGRQEDLLRFQEVIYEDGVGYAISPKIRWAEDSSRLRVVIPQTASPEGETMIAVYEISAVDGTGKRLATVQAMHTVQNTFSPDLRYLLYLKRTDETTTELHILDLDQGEDSIIYTGPQVRLENWEPWNPDSSAFLFSINNQFQLAHPGSGYNAVPVEGVAQNALWVNETSYLVYTGEAPNFQLDFIKIGSPPVTIATMDESFPSFDVHE